MLKKVEIMRCTLVKEREIEYMANSDDAVIEIAEKIGLLKDTEEHVYLLCLNTKLHVVGIHQLSHGDIASSAISQASLFKRVLLNNSERFILVHNHPSGDVVPSTADMIVTSKINQSAKLLGLTLVDHIIVSFNEDSYSFVKNGML